MMPTKKRKPKKPPLAPHPLAARPPFLDTLLHKQTKEPLCPPRY